MKTGILRWVRFSFLPQLRPRKSPGAAFTVALGVLLLCVMLGGCDITRDPDGGFQVRPADGAIEALNQALGVAIQGYLNADDPVERADFLERIYRLRVEIEAWRELRDSRKAGIDADI